MGKIICGNKKKDAFNYSKPLVALNEWTNTLGA